MVAATPQKRQRRGAAKAKPLSLRAYARHRKAAGLPGGNLQAVQQARDAGRIRVDAGGKIPDAARADREWLASTRAEHVPLTGPTAPRGSSDAPPSDGGVDGSTGIPLAEARARLDAAKAALAELDLAERRAELVEVAKVDERLVGVFSRCKTKLEGVPARARQQDPALTLPQLALFESLIREALSELAEEAEAAQVPDEVAS